MTAGSFLWLRGKASWGWSQHTHTHTGDGRARSAAQNQSPSPAQTRPTSPLGSPGSGSVTHPRCSLHHAVWGHIHILEDKGHCWLIIPLRTTATSEPLPTYSCLRCSLPLCHDTLDFVFVSKHKASESSRFNCKHRKHSGGRVGKKGSHSLPKVYILGQNSQDHVWNGNRLSRLRVKAVSSSLLSFADP